MDGNTQQRRLSSGVLLAAGMIAAQCAVAAPPLHALQISPQRLNSVQTQHLDLRAPLHMAEMADNAANRAFPSRHQTAGPQAAAQLPALGIESVRARPTAQEFVRRVHQEGLPVARLFEGKSALVHLGFSPKGKPGLWLVQKTR